MPSHAPEGLVNLLTEVRTSSRTVAQHHASQAKATETAAVEPLKKLRVEIKSFIRSLEAEVAKREAAVLEHRDTSAVSSLPAFQYKQLKLVVQVVLSDLAHSLAAARSNSSEVDARTDPYIVDRAARKTLEAQATEENDLHQATAIWQQKAGEFEQHILQQIKTAWVAFMEWQTRTTPLVVRVSLCSVGVCSLMEQGKEWATLTKRIEAAPTDAEWARYLQIHSQLDPNAPLRNVKDIDFPGRDDELSAPVREGGLQRKKRFTKVLSPHLAL